MRNGISLTSTEKNKLAKLGFLVKDYSTYWGLIKTLLFWQFASIWIMLFPVLIIVLRVSFDLGFFMFHIIFFYKILVTLLSYIFVGKLFIFYNSGRLKVIYPFSSDLLRSVKSIEEKSLNLKKTSIILTITGAIALILFITLLTIPLVGVFTNEGPSLYFSLDFFIRYLIFSSITYSVVSLVYWIGKSIVNSTNGFYTFGNLGEKIQSLTPRISEQSKEIESGFRGDMDFRVLSKSFDSLASTFSQIVNLVVKLEQVEQKANKGDLFDSTKYINSLREDIRTPLLSLRTFLEEKKAELESSQQELMRVRVNVGGANENRELQSARSQELLKELDENIGKLNDMIKKL